MAGSQGTLQVECKFAYKVKHSCKVKAAPWCRSTQLEFWLNNSMQLHLLLNVAVQMYWPFGLRHSPYIS